MIGHLRFVLATILSTIYEKVKNVDPACRAYVAKRLPKNSFHEDHSVQVRTNVIAMDFRP